MDVRQRNGSQMKPETITKALFVAQCLVMFVICLLCLLTGYSCKLDEIVCLRMRNLSTLGIVFAGIQILAGSCSFIKACLFKPIHGLGAYARYGITQVTVALFALYWIVVVMQLFLHVRIVYVQTGCKNTDKQEPYWTGTPDSSVKQKPWPDRTNKR